MEATFTPNLIAHDALADWQREIKDNCYTTDIDFIHSIQFYFKENFKQINVALEKFGMEVTSKLEPLVSENNQPINLPRLEAYDAIGERIDKIIHHPTYAKAGEIIYQTGLLKNIKEPGGLLTCLALLFLSSQAGEAGHNCPIACSAGIIRVLQKISHFPNKDFYLEKLTSPSYQTNFTGAQFLTEIQGGSDVGQNTVFAKKDNENNWRIYGEKWFCSNAGANLIFVTARYNQNLPGTKGLGLFLVPAIWDDHKNNYIIHRLKDKIGTRSMATGEIEFQGACAIPVGALEEGFHLVMDNVLHLSRLFNTFSVLGMGRRAYMIAKAYSHHRIAFSHAIINYPLVKETLAGIKAENTAMLAAIFATTHLQDQLDQQKAADPKTKLLLRLLVNFQKYLSALWSVEHIHQALGILAGNGTIEIFSPLPRLLRDCIVCENWEGTHNVLRVQILKDIHKYEIDKIFIDFMQAEIIKNSNAKDNRIQLITNEIEKLQTELIQFKKLKNELQSLQICVIVDRMAIIYCAFMLLIEALDQQKKTKSSSKLDCFEYFWLRHLGDKKITYDNNYLELISRII